MCYATDMTEGESCESTYRAGDNVCLHERDPQTDRMNGRDPERASGCIGDSLSPMGLLCCGRMLASAQDHGAIMLMRYFRRRTEPCVESLCICLALV